MPHSPDFEEEVTHADQDMYLKDEMELQIALADPRLVDDDVLEKAGFKPGLRGQSSLRVIELTATQILASQLAATKTSARLF